MSYLDGFANNYRDYRDACLCRNSRLINILKVELMCFFTSLLDSFH